MFAFQRRRLQAVYRGEVNRRVYTIPTRGGEPQAGIINVVNLGLCHSEGEAHKFPVVAAQVIYSGWGVELASTAIFSYVLLFL